MQGKGYIVCKREERRNETGNSIAASNFEKVKVGWASGPPHAAASAVIIQISDKEKVE
jgi:hypothetical protein